MVYYISNFIVIYRIRKKYVTIFLVQSIYTYTFDIFNYCTYCLTKFYTLYNKCSNMSFYNFLQFISKFKIRKNNIFKIKRDSI